MKLPQFQAHAAMEERHWWFLARRDIVAALLHALLPPKKETKLLDVGCGTGGLTQFFSKEYSVTGIDPSADAIAFAKKKFPSCEFIHGHAEKHPEKLREADGILLIEVLEHIEDDEVFVKNILDAMKPGALLFMMAPADLSLWSPHDDAFEHFRRYDSLEEFRDVWRGSSVNEILMSHCNARLHPVIKFLRKLNSLRRKSWGQGGTDIEVPVAPLNAMLRKIFGGEKSRLLRALQNPSEGYVKGVSVIGILRKC